MKKRLIGFLMAFVLIVSALPASMITVHAETFDISLPAAQTEGGEITTYTYAEEGDEVTVYVAPDENYALTALTVSGDNVNLNLENGITKATDNIYIFTMPGTAVSIIPEFTYVEFSGTKLLYDTENGEIRIKSNTSYDNARLIIAKYTNDRKLVDYNIESISLTAGETYIKNYFFDQRYDTKIMLWANMRPLATVNTSNSANASSLGNVFVNTTGTGTYGNPILSLAGVPNTSDRHTIGALDVSIKNGEELNGIAEIRIKYDKSKGFDAQNLLPGYFNPETNQWETVPYMLDEEHGEVVILTDHFSRFGLFEVERSGTPTAFAKPLTAAQLVNMPSTTASKLLGLAKTGNMDFNEDAVAEVLNALDGSYNNNYTNTAGAVNTLVSKGGAISTGFLGTIGKQFAIIGVTAAAINTAKTVYTKGVTTDTALTTGKSIMGLIPYPPIQIAYAIYGLAEMAYTHYDEKVMTENKSALLHHFKMFQYEKICKDISQENYHRWYAFSVDANPYADDLTSKMTYWNDYGLMEYWDARFKDCYDSVYAKDTAGNTSENAARRFERFKSSITNQIYAYAHEFSAHFVNNNRQYMLEANDWNKALAADICENYAAQLMNRLSPLFKKYSLLAYNDAIKLLEKECEDLRTELNKTVTLNFYEDDGSGIAKDCYILFDSAKDNSWRADFDSEGKTTLSFSLLGYSQIRCPDSAVVYNKNTEKPIGRIPLPDRIDPGETYSIPFHPGDFTQTVKIHEVLEKSTDDYMFAGLHGRLCDLTEVANAEKFHFTLDSKGRATLELSLHDYVDAGAPEWLEIIDAEGGVVYQTRFSIAMTDIPLGGNSYGVNIRCGDNASIKKYRNSKAKIVYYENEDAEPEVIAETTVDYEGRARLIFDRSLYEFKGKKYWLYVCYTDSLENIELFEEYDLSRSFQNGKKMKNVVLSAESQYKEELRIKESAVTLGVGDGKQITVLAGEISDLEIGDETVATSTVEGYIVGHNPGTTTITYMNQYGSKETVTVSVTKPIDDFYEAYYRVWQISEKTEAPKFDISDGKTWNIGERLIDYAHVQFHIDRFSGKIDTAWITYQGDQGRTYCYSDNTGAVPGEGIDFAGRLIRLTDGQFDENDYLENVSTANFKRSLMSYMGDFMFIQGCYFEETDLTGFPD